MYIFNGPIWMEYWQYKFNAKFVNKDSKKKEIKAVEEKGYKITTEG